VVQAASPADLLGTGGRQFDGERHAKVTRPPTDGTTPDATPPSDPTGTDPTASDPKSLASHVTTVGTDWTTSAIITGANIPSQLGPLLNGADRITVGSTSARVISTTLFSVLLLDDGRVAVGAVSPTALAALVAGAPS